MPRRIRPDGVSERELGRALASGLGAGLKRHREAAGLSRPQLGERSGLHRSRIAALERGKFEPRLGTLLRIAAGLGVSPDELLEGIGWEPDQLGNGAFVLDGPAAGDGRGGGEQRDGRCERR